MAKSTIAVDMSEQDKELLLEWQELFGFTSQRQTVEYFMGLGMMSAELAVARPLTASGFANALYTIGSRFVSAEFGREGIAQTIEEFKQWQEHKRERLQPTRSNIKALRQSG
jgi:hypothetical protein